MKKIYSIPSKGQKIRIEKYLRSKYGRMFYLLEVALQQQFSNTGENIDRAQLKARVKSFMIKHKYKSIIVEQNISLKPFSWLENIYCPFI